MILLRDHKIFNTEVDEKLLTFGFETLYRTEDNDYYIYGDRFFVDRGFESAILYKNEEKTLREWISVIPTKDDLIEILIEEFIARDKND